MKLGVCYYPEQWPESAWQSDAARMSAMGLHAVRIAEFAWARIEAQPGAYDWGWLDRAIDTLAGAGLQIILGTPTASPPHWLVERHPEILPVNAQGRTKAFGSRRHYCFSSDTYLRECRRIVDAMARRYGKHPAVIAWQIDNEFGCHDTVLSYSPAALRRFRLWLAERYGSIDELNRRWGTVFWSCTYARFEDIGLPADLPAQVHPLHALDFRRFASDEVLRHNRMQAQVLREHSPGRDVLHNFMGFFTDFEQHEAARDLDVAAWDSYPLGTTETVRFVGAQERQRWMRVGHPDVAAFSHDLYRCFCGRRFWVIEQQVGPVNWAAWNPIPQPGMVRTWTWEAFAHGAELMSYFRWRQVPYAQEQMHSGLNTPDDTVAPGGIEAAQVAGELKSLLNGAAPEPVSRAAVALVMDYASKWMLDIQPQSADFDYLELVFSWYSALRQLGLDIDIVSRQADFAQYRLIVVPTLLITDADFVRRLATSTAQIVLGPRCGSKTEDFAIPPGMPPDGLVALMPMRVQRVDAFRPGCAEPVWCDEQRVGEATRWRDVVEPQGDAIVDARYTDGAPALLRHGRTRCVTGWIDANLLRSLLREAAADAEIPVVNLPENLRMRRRGSLQFAINYGPDPAPLPCPANADFVLGASTIGTGEVAAWRIASQDQAS